MTTMTGSRMPFGLGLIVSGMLSLSVTLAAVSGRVTGAIVNGFNPSIFSLTFTDFSHAAFDSEALPSSPPNLSSFASKGVSLYFSGPLGSSFLDGKITFLTAVPVPAAVLLFGTGLTALIGLGAGDVNRSALPKRRHSNTTPRFPRLLARTVVIWSLVLRANIAARRSSTSGLLHHGPGEYWRSPIQPLM